MRPAVNACLASALGILIAGSVQAAPVLWSDNGHWYDVVAGPTNWNAASAAASASTFMGIPGHLATITSAQENRFISMLGSDLTLYLIGGFQDPSASSVAAGWTWVTGESFGFTNWQAGEPNDFPNAVEAVGPGSEDFLAFWTGTDAEGRAWNDVNEISGAGYVVEFDPARIPEPATLALLGIGLAGLGLSRRKRALAA